MINGRVWYVEAWRWKPEGGSWKHLLLSGAIKSILFILFSLFMPHTIIQIWEYQKQALVFQEFHRDFDKHKMKRENMDRNNWMDRMERIMCGGRYDDKTEGQGQDTDTAWIWTHRTMNYAYIQYKTIMEISWPILEGTNYNTAPLRHCQIYKRYIRWNFEGGVRV